jgi:hypothetical protein
MKKELVLVFCLDAGAPQARMAAKINRRSAQPWLGVLLLLGLSVSQLHSHEARGRGGHKHGEAPEVLEAEFESYFGRHGYYHAGLGLQMPLNERQKLGLITHLVREDSSSPWVSSLGAEYGLRLEHDVELEAFSFGYFPARDQDAWAIGLRARKGFEVSEAVHLSAFFGPTFARVRAVDEGTGNSVHVDHTMLFGGVLIEFEPIEVILFGSQSLFSRSPRGLESHVDLEEMTHFAVYENNDGLARNSVGIDARWEYNASLEFSARYAAIFFAGESTRHSIMLSPAWQIAERLQIFGGVQFLRGGPGNNDIGFGGISLRF